MSNLCISRLIEERNQLKRGILKCYSFIYIYQHKHIYIYIIEYITIEGSMMLTMLKLF